MLEFNPYFRPTAKDLLKNKIFDEYRMPELEEKCPSRIKIDIDLNCEKIYKEDYTEFPK